MSILTWVGELREHASEGGQVHPEAVPLVQIGQEGLGKDGARRALREGRQMVPEALGYRDLSLVMLGEGWWSERQGWC